MKSNPAKYRAIFIVCAAVMAVIGLLGGALVFSGSTGETPLSADLPVSEGNSALNSTKDTADELTAVHTPAPENPASFEQTKNNPSGHPSESSEKQPQAPVEPQDSKNETDTPQNPSADRENDLSSSGNRPDTFTHDNKSSTKETRYAYLTFDDGPSKNTDEILRILAENGIKATFFVTARNTDSTNMQRYQKIVKSGHTLAMHSGTHNYREIYASVDAFIADYSRVSDLLYEITGTRSLIYRFPGGSSNTLSCRKVPMTQLIDELHKRGVEYYDWNVNSTDASGKNPDPEILVKSVTAGLKYRHNIILMHDSSGHETTVEALPDIIQACRNQNMTFAVITPQTPPTHHHRRD